MRKKSLIKSRAAAKKALLATKKGKLEKGKLSSTASGLGGGSGAGGLGGGSGAGGLGGGSGAGGLGSASF